MQILKIQAQGLSLFPAGLAFDFLAMQRVSARSAETMHCIFRNFYQKNVLAVIGLNASGKTTLLKIITFALRLLNNESINHINDCEILDELDKTKEVIFNIYFYANNWVYWLHTVIGKKEEHCFIKEEVLKAKESSKVKTKKALYDFEKADVKLFRKPQEDFLPADVSIMIAFNRRNHEKIRLIDMLRCTNINQLNINEDIPAELIAFFDPNIEYLHIEKRAKTVNIHLKFKEKAEIILDQFSALNRYLSAGTTKGINLFMNALDLFQTGGYLIVDKLENHLNQEVVLTLIRFFMDKRINSKGAVLVFSTHCVELLDVFERKDNIYITRNGKGITMKNNITKSKFCQSEFLKATIPPDKAYHPLVDEILKQMSK